MNRIGRRDFFKHAAGALGAATHIPRLSPFANAEAEQPKQRLRQGAERISFPRIFTGSELKMLAFPLGGVAAGSVALGGRGQLRDWEIFNRPNKGFSPQYAFPSIWVKAGNATPITRVLEARILPPYEGQDGLGSSNAPGLSRIATAEFRAQYPLAEIAFKDPDLPVRVTLGAFSPFIPHDPDASGLPVAILRYRVANLTEARASVAISFSIDNPVKAPTITDVARANEDPRVNEYQKTGSMEGLLMTNPSLSAHDPMQGSFALAVISDGGGQTTYWRGWPRGRWWNSPMLFWDAFSQDGALLNEPAARNAVGALCRQRSIPAGGSAEFTFLLAWHFPNRTPEWCGWDAPSGEGQTIIGNYYCTRFKNAWEAAAYTAANLPSLEERTRTFAKTFAASTLPAAVKEAASANLSTLATTTCFRTADGEFHGFEGSDDHRGCCFGNCTHVWNYETATAFLFPSYARSLRGASFGYSMDEQGGMRFRQLLPDGKQRYHIAAADGQMGQIMHAYLDWKLSGDSAWLRTMWPRVKKAIEFAWIPGGWDANRDGVLDGVQHNTYDVEFYGPNPLCGIYYLGALRAAEEMGRAAGDNASANEYRRLFDQGSRWIDAHLFRGEFYVQEIRGFRPDQIAPQLRSGMGSENTEQPEYQVGQGCLIDQLLGQYLADIAGLGPLVSSEHVRLTLDSIYRYNYKRTLVDHDTVQRTYALNDEAAVVVCDYGKAPRPHIPFPYYAEAWTGLEHSTAALMFYSGMIAQGVEYVENLRARYDGVKRNPWDEAECGHHYARAMSSWSSVVALSGFHYEGDRAHVSALPRLPHDNFQCFWATGTGWGTYSLKRSQAGSVQFVIHTLAGRLPCKSCAVPASGSRATAHVGERKLGARLAKSQGQVTVEFDQPIELREGEQLVVGVS
ncbi:MAG TPA: GH116 family glycosyl-hydrolase [Acidobacteriaceae bacterium]|nr:GH116 family glycosyl-hydrolase [Acidobacteriaceae bacterium]